MDPTARTKLLENIQNDLKNISLETKKTKSLQPIRESTDEAIVKIRSLVRVHYMFSRILNLRNLNIFSMKFVVCFDLFYPNRFSYKSQNMYIMKYQYN